jgi:lysozyme
MNTVTQSTIDLIIGEEGFRAAPYHDSGSAWAIGYGFDYWNGVPVTPHTTPITQQQANSIILEKIQPYADAVNKYVHVPLTQNQFNALVSFCYNEGPGGLLSSSLLKAINAKKPILSHYFTDWDKDMEGGKLTINQGLINRRMNEYRVFIS